MKLDELNLAILPDEGDPLVWIRRHRDELAEKYPSVDALCDYYDQFSSVDVALARVQTRIDAQQRELETVE